VQTDRIRPLIFGRSVTPVELVYFSSRSTLVQAQFFPENFLNKGCELQFFSSRKNKLRGNVRNETTVIFGKFGADLINTSKITSRKTKCFDFKVTNKFFGLLYI